MNRLAALEHWTRALFRTRRTRRIEDAKHELLRECRDTRNFLRRLDAANKQNDSVVKALEERLHDQK